MRNNQLMKTSELHQRIFSIRDAQVMIDADLADLYQVDTKVLNQAVKRNIGRFPEHFRFQLTEEEKDELVTNCDRLAFSKMEIGTFELLKKIKGLV
ncbi:MAG: ORF6N domain-containing protein [Leptospirales bacterium]